MTDPDPNEFAQCLPSPHLRTLAALMQQQGVEITYTDDETNGGIPYFVLVVQGRHTEQIHQLAKTLLGLFEQWSQDQQNEIERG